MEGDDRQELVKAGAAAGSAGGGVTPAAEGDCNNEGEPTGLEGESKVLPEEDAGMLEAAPTARRLGILAGEWRRVKPGD